MEFFERFKSKVKDRMVNSNDPMCRILHRPVGVQFVTFTRVDKILIQFT